MTLDIPTMYFVSVVTNVAMTIAVMIVALRQSIPGLKLLAWGLLANSGYYLVLGARGTLPDMLAIGVGNTLGSLTLTLCLLAVLYHSRARMASVLYIVPIVLMVVVSLALIHDRESRLIIASLVLCYQIALILWALLRGGNVIVGRGRTIMVAAAAVATSMMAYRALALGIGWHEVTPFQSRDSLNTIFHMINYLGMFFLAFGFVLSTIEQVADQNRRLALEDPLTGLSNRRALFEAMDGLFVRAEAAGQPLSLMIIDVDLFKQVNDRFGHQAGDTVLQLVATTIKQRLRNNDIVGRFGGEEFLAVLPDTPPDGAIQVAEELCQTLASKPVVVDGQEIGVTISIGLYSSGCLASTQTPDAVIATADEALYRAKENGRNRVEITEVTMAVSA
ncbi:MAG: GGDEF domain-containing protein [Candidatus Thiodiazotropha sp. (ex Lucinoma kastoroae)]|nr:GGDEF domain-containing protein [Candidatus Thiodiazotropha sp. (ex Lucinoma kastoroae)]